jgi:nitroreductase
MRIKGTQEWGNVMNKVIETINSRRSIRSYTDQQIPKETIELLLTAAMNAPSACNQQIWHFIVVTDRDKLEQLSKFHDGVKYVKSASVAIIICGEPGAAILDYYWVDDCAAATQNLLLAAHSLGLGAVWTGINRQDTEAIEFYRRILAISDQYIPFAMVPIGYPTEVIPAHNNYDEKKVLWN